MKFKSYTLAELATIKYGKNQSKVICESSKYPIYGTGGFMGYASRPLYDKPSVLIGRKGTIGRVKYVEHPFWTVDTLFYTEVNEQIVFPHFLYYAMSLIDLNIYNEGTTIPSLRTETLNRLELLIPDIEEQRKILSILESIDKKIEINSAINHNLQQQAEALYKDYFVNFSATNGEIPLSWKKYILADFLPVITGKKNANISSEKGKYPFFSCSQDIAWTDEYSFEGSAILVAGNGDFNVKWYDGKFEAYQRTYVLIPRNSRFTAWLYYAIKYNLNIITSAARGSVIKFITKGNLEDFSFYAPNSLSECDIIDTFTKINETIDMHTQENYKLSTLRDTLLPKLMSGEIDVSEVEV